VTEHFACWVRETSFGAAVGYMAHIFSPHMDGRDDEQLLTGRAPVLSGQAIIDQLKSVEASWIEDTDHDQVQATEDVMVGKQLLQVASSCPAAKLDCRLVSDMPRQQGYQLRAVAFHEDLHSTRCVRSVLTHKPRQPVTELCLLRA
jgi:hypothetical protein